MAELSRAEQQDVAERAGLGIGAKATGRPGFSTELWECSKICVWDAVGRLADSQVFVGSSCTFQHLPPGGFMF